MNDVVGDITGVRGVGILRRGLIVLREIGHAGAFSERVGVVGGCVGSSGESNAENHDAVLSSSVVASVVACSRVVAVVAALRARAG